MFRGLIGKAAVLALPILGVFAFASQVFAAGSNLTVTVPPQLNICVGNDGTNQVTVGLSATNAGSGGVYAFRVPDLHVAVTGVGDDQGNLRISKTVTGDLPVAVDGIYTWTLGPADATDGQVQGKLTATEDCATASPSPSSSSSSSPAPSPSRPSAQPSASPAPSASPSAALPVTALSTTPSPTAHRSQTRKAAVSTQDAGSAEGTNVTLPGTWTNTKSDNSATLASWFSGLSPTFGVWLAVGGALVASLAGFGLVKAIRSRRAVR